MIKIDEEYLEKVIREHLRYGYTFEYAVLLAMLHIPQIAKVILKVVEEERE